jgi:hypothetical protein
MKNAVKIRKACKSANTLPMATRHILSNIPDSVVDALTSKQLGELIVAMSKHFYDGVNQADAEIRDFIGLPANMSLWAVIGDGFKTDKDFVNFSDGLNLVDVLEARGQQIANHGKKLYRVKGTYGQNCPTAIRASFLAKNKRDLAMQAAEAKIVNYIIEEVV